MLPETLIPVRWFQSLFKKSQMVSFFNSHLNPFSLTTLSWFSYLTNLSQEMVYVANLKYISRFHQYLLALYVISRIKNFKELISLSTFSNNRVICSETRQQMLIMIVIVAFHLLMEWHSSLMNSMRYQLQNLGTLLSLVTTMKLF